MIIPFKKKKPHKTREGKICLTLQAHSVDTVIDIGASVGSTHRNLRNGGFCGDIISVEPLPALQAGLQEQAAKDPRWSVLPPLALGDKNGECEINMSESSDLSSLLPASNALTQALPRSQVVETVNVEIKTLDTLYAELGLEGKKVFIKMDTQGYEMPILRAAPETLKAISGLQVEMSLFELYSGETLFDEIIAFLKEAGFRPHMLIETNFSRRLNRQLQVDGVFFRD